jgi:hypothetical protein
MGERTISRAFGSSGANRQQERKNLHEDVAPFLLGTV